VLQVLFYGAGWRSAFGAGCIIAIIGIIARIALKETPEFLDAKRRYKKILEKIIDDKKNRNNIYLIKLFDRLHNMQTISFQSIEKQKKIASETLIYILPIAIYLEISKVEKLLADICERVLLNPSVQNSHTESEYIKKNPEDYINRLIEKLEELNYYDKGKIDISLVSRAIDCARTYHGGQKRLSGEPYYVHPVEVAYLIIYYANHQSYISTDIIVSAILHDIVEDTDFTIEMIKLSFGIGVSKIVYGLTRVRKEKKLTVPELLDSIFNDQSSLIYTHKNKGDIISFIYYTFIGAVWPLWFYINYVHSGSVLKSKFGFSSEEIIANSTIISFIEILACMVCVYLSSKIHPLKITKVKTYLFLPVAFLYPFLLSNCSSGNDVFWLQALCVIFVPGTFPADSAMIPHFYVFKRFTYSCMSYSISRALVYIISSFGFVLLIKYCGNIGMLYIIIPIMISSIFGINYFISLEKKTGYYDL
jgi:hypothetical protein